jgi:hypothetical protein
MTSPILVGHLDATIRRDHEQAVWLECDQCRWPMTAIEPGMSLDDLLMAYAIHEHAA